MSVLGVAEVITWRAIWWRPALSATGTRDQPRIGQPGTGARNTGARIGKKLFEAGFKISLDIVEE